MMESLWLALFTLGFLGVLILSKKLREKYPHQPELSRKITHIAVGLGSLFFPWVFQSILPVAILSFVFFVLLLGLMLSKRMQSIFQVGRKSLGALVFPLVIFLLFWLGKDQPVFYVISLLVLTLSDSFAALVGQYYGKIPFSIDGHIKTVEGSLTFGLIAFLCILIPLILMTSMVPQQAVLLALGISLLVTAFELVSLAGSDNFFVPIGTWFLLDRMSQYSLEFNLHTSFQFISVMSLMIFIFWGIKNVHKSAVIIFTLANMSAIGLSDSNWYGAGWHLGLLLFQVVFSLILRLLAKQQSLHTSFFDMKSALIMIVFPVLIHFALVFFGNHSRLYGPYLFFLSTFVTLMIYWFINIKKSYTYWQKVGYYTLVSMITSLIFLGLFGTLAPWGYFSVYALLTGIGLSFFFAFFVPIFHSKNGSEKSLGNMVQSLTSVAAGGLFFVLRVYFWPSDFV
jgi:dolichol kinase